MESINKTAFVTGATSGIGYHLTRHLARHGYNRVLIAKAEKNLQGEWDEIVNEFGTQQVIIIPKDFPIPDSAEECEETQKRELKATILINKLRWLTMQKKLRKRGTKHS